MIKKVILNTLFGKPYPDEWINGFINNVQHLKKYGWYWKIFTPNQIESKGNVEIIPMTLDEFNSRVEKYTGAIPTNFINPETGFPRKLMTDYAPALAAVLPEYVEGFDWWGHVNWDVVYGRLDKWLTDEFLNGCDIFGNDPGAINGVFSLYRNTDYINRLFSKHPAWKDVFENSTNVYTFEEQMFTNTVLEAQDRRDINFRSAHWLQYARQPQHKPLPQLTIKPDGSLVDKDGEEMMIFHFSFTKRWPL